MTWVTHRARPLLAGRPGDAAQERGEFDAALSPEVVGRFCLALGLGTARLAAANCPERAVELDGDRRRPVQQGLPGNRRPDWGHSEVVTGPVADFSHLEPRWAQDPFPAVRLPAGTDP